MPVPHAFAIASTVPPAGTGSPSRRSDLDWLRGLMLVLMTITHLPTAFSGPLGQPFGFVSAAEGFVFLSAFLVGSVYSRVAMKDGEAAMRRALAGRALKVYAAHVALLGLLFFVLVPLAMRPGGSAITDLASFYVHHPRSALAGGLLLVYNPPLLDILPMYVIFLALTPRVLATTSRAGWTSVLVGSVSLWLLAQAGVGARLYAPGAHLLHVPGSYGDTGAFSFLAWQLMWVAGLWAGASVARSRGAAPSRPWQRPGVVALALVVAAVGFAWRHLVGQAPFGAHEAANALFDKWHLGPLRLLDFAALAILAVRGRALLAAWAADSPITALGRASLPVFCAHLVLCLALLAVAGYAPPTLPGLADAAILGASLALLYGVALVALKAPTPKAAGGTDRAMPRMAR